METSAREHAMADGTSLGGCVNCQGASDLSPRDQARQALMLKCIHGYFDVYSFYDGFSMSTIGMYAYLRVIKVL